MSIFIRNISYDLYFLESPIHVKPDGPVLWQRMTEYDKKPDPRPIGCSSTRARQRVCLPQAIFFAKRPGEAAQSVRGHCKEFC